MNIYSYTQPEIYLKDMLAAKKEKNPQFSLRAWARLLGMKTHTPLQLMLASKRPIPKKYIPLFGKSLSLSEEDVHYLEIMIDHQRARNEADKAIHRDRMTAILKSKSAPLVESSVAGEDSEATGEESSSAFMRKESDNSAIQVFR